MLCLRYVRKGLWEMLTWQLLGDTAGHGELLSQRQGWEWKSHPRPHLPKPHSCADYSQLKTGFHSFHNNKIATHGFFSDEFLLLSDFSLPMNYCQTVTPPLLPRKYNHLFSPCAVGGVRYETGTAPAPLLCCRHTLASGQRRNHPRVCGAAELLHFPFYYSHWWPQLQHCVLEQQKPEELWGSLASIASCRQLLRETAAWCASQEEKVV